MVVISEKTEITVEPSGGWFMIGVAMNPPLQYEHNP